jgi:hypothetical protein
MSKKPKAPQLPYADLKRIVDDLFGNTGPAIQFLFRGTINKFLEQYKLQITTMNNKIKALVTYHCNHDDDGKPLTEVKENGETVYVYETEEKRLQHEKEYSQFMSQTFDVK